MLDGQPVVREMTNTETVTYLTGPRGPEYRRTTTGSTNQTDVTRWYSYDGLGSVLGEIGGSTGDLVNARVYGSKLFKVN